MHTISKPILLSCVVLGLAAGHATACNGRQASAKPLARVVQVSPTNWNVYVPGWKTVAISNGTYCGIGLSVPASGRITGVNLASMVRESNNVPVSELLFSPSSAVAAAFNAQQAGNWTGFLGQASGAISAGINNMYCFNVDVKAGTTKAQLETELKGSWVGSDKANANGSLAGTNKVIFKFTTVTEAKCNFNFRMFHNVNRSNVSTRATAGSADTLYFMQPRNFRFGTGDATGWQILLQDENPATAEEVTVGYVKYASATSKLPNVTAGGKVASATYMLFGAGGSRAVEYVLTTSAKIKTPPFIGLSLVAPAPNSWPSDGVTLHTQDGGQSKLAASLRDQWTYRLSGGSATAFRAAGTTHHFAGLYDAPATQIAAFSKAYGPLRRLYGPESLYPDVTNGDFVSFLVTSGRHKKLSVALILISPDYLPAGLPTPFGEVLVQAFVTMAVVPVNAQGLGPSIGFPLVPKVKIAAQSFILDFSDNSMQFSDAARCTAR